MSLVLVGEVPAADRMELERFARVLPIESATPDTAEIENAVAVLLPLTLPTNVLLHGSDPVNEVLAALGPAKVTAEHVTLVNAANDGPGAVREALRRYANEGAGWQEEVDDHG